MGKKILWVIMGLIGTIVAVNIIIWISSPLKTELIRQGSIETVVTSSGFIVRDENLITLPVHGATECLIKEGERVPVGKKLVTLYKGEIDPSIQDEIKKIDKKLELYESMSSMGDIFTSDAFKLDAQIMYKIETVADMSNRGDVGKLSSVKDEISIMLHKRRAALGIINNDKSNDINELLLQRTALEEKLGNNYEIIYASNTGLFSTAIDGYEQILSCDKLNTYMPSEIITLSKQKIKPPSKNQPGAAVAKIVDNYEWYIISTVSERDMRLYSVGQTVSIRLHDMQDKSFDAVIKYISPVENGMTLITFSCNRQFESMISDRNISFDIVSDKYAGYKVQNQAIRMDGDRKGIYILKDSKAEFVDVKIIGFNDDFTIIENTDENIKYYRGFRIYDDVVIKGLQE